MAEIFVIMALGCAVAAYDYYTQAPYGPKSSDTIDLKPTAPIDLLSKEKTDKPTPSKDTVG